MMRRGKADRFERLAKKEIKSPWVMNEARLAMLLHREHQAVVRLVRKEILYPVGKSERCEGWNQALQCILELLKARAR